jgi:hypothetical protein
MVEFGVEDKKSLLDFAGEKKGMGSKPLLLFVGDQWENDNLYKSIQNIFIDFFRGDKATKISLKGVDHAIGFTCIDGRIHLRGYNLSYQKSDSKVGTHPPHCCHRTVHPSIAKSCVPYAYRLHPSTHLCVNLAVGAYPSPYCRFPR